MKRIGRYEVISELGRGGAGVVFKAWDPQERAHVAIKLLLQVDRRRLRRFQREGQVLQRLRHPNVIPVRAIGEDGGRPFLVMDFVDGQTLEDLVDEQGPLPAQRVAELGAALARALGAGHELGILHRDVKPANVLLRADGEVVLGDFGLAKDVAMDVSQLTVEGGFMGTLGYVAPEQAQGKAELLGPATDVYGLGATLYCALTGRAPIPGKTMIEVLDNLQRPPQSIRELRPDLPESLAALVHRCLQPLVRERYTSCALVEQDLRRFLAGTLSAPPAVAASGGLQRVALGLAVVLVLTLLSAGLVYALRVSRPSDDPSVSADTVDPPAASDAPRPLADVLREAQAAAEVDDWGAARFGFEQVLLRDPQHADGLHGLWLVLNEVQDPQQIEVLRRAVEVQARPRASLAVANLHASDGDDAAAIRELQRALEAYPENLKLLTTLGSFLAQLGEHAEAAALLGRAWEQERSYATALTLGSCLQQLGRLEDALQVVDRAIEFEPDSLHANYIQGTLRLAMGDTQGALEPLERVWALSQGDFSLVVSPLARVLRDSGRAEDAIAVLSRGLADAPQNIDFLHERALVYAQLEDAEAELADLSAVLLIDPSDREALINRAIVVFRQGDYPAALADAERVVKAYPDLAKGWIQLGACHYALEAWAPSREAYSRAIELDPENEKLRIGRGQAAQKLEEHEAAIADYSWVLVRQPDLHSVRWHLGIAYDDSGETELALQTMQDMLQRAEEGTREYIVAEEWIRRLTAKLEREGSEGSEGSAGQD